LLYSSAYSLNKYPRGTDIKDWRRVEQMTFSYRRILNSPVIVSLLMAQDKNVYNAGQTEYFQYSHYPSGWLDRFLLSNSDISNQRERYENSIRQAVSQRAFDAVITTPYEHASYLESLPENYRMVDTVGICMFHTEQCVPVEIWEPKH
jgi:hypothetical protein